MKQMVIFPVLACLLSFGATTGYLVTRYKPARVAVDSVSVRGDTAAVDSLKHAVVKHGSAAPDTSHAAAEPDSARQHREAVLAAPPIGPAAAPIPVALPTMHAVPQLDPVAKAGAYKQVARVLSAMKAVEAAKVLAYLSDEEVEGLLRAVGPRQAADFLTNIPKERAAGLSRRLLVPTVPSR